MFQTVRSVDMLSNLLKTHDDLITKIYPTLSYLGNDYKKIKDRDNPEELIVHDGAISISGISFDYVSEADAKKENKVFQNLSLTIKGGEKVGIVGLSGAGKSTLASLLLRFDEVSEGSISIDDIDIRNVRQNDLHKKIAYVPQEPLLFHRSIKENIMYYNHDISEEEMILSAKAAHAHEFIEKLPHGYDTLVGERGVKLSGGQKQRVVIARAILKKAPIMLFDEATSALDSESEHIIQRALPEIIGRQTAIVIAHRLSTVAGLDRIIVMHDGKIVESGSHQELLVRNGRYASLWQKQTKDFM
jgi:ATP-binding cassette subfamily B protein